MADRSITVHLRAEVNDFAREMARGAQSLDALVKKSGDAAGAANTTLGRIVQSARLQSDAWRAVGGSVATAGAATLGVGAAVAKTGIAYNTLQQTSRAALGTILGGAQKANAQMEQLDAFARTSPFSKQVFIQAQQQMLAFGIESQKVIPYLSAINDAVAASGGNSQMLGEVAFVIAQIGAAGKITATDLMQLGQRGINAAELIGSKMGMTGAEVRASITKGSLDAGEALDALAAGMSERFAGASAAVKDTMGGALDRVSAAWRDLTATIMSSAVDPNGGGWLVDLTNELANFMRLIGEIPGPVLEGGAAIAGLAGAGAVGVGGLMVLLPKTIETISAYRTLAAEFPKAAGAITGIGKAAGAAGVTLAALAVALRLTTEQYRPLGDVAAEIEAIAAGASHLADLKNVLPDISYLGGLEHSAKDLGELVTQMQSYYDVAGDHGSITAFFKAANRQASEFASLLPGVTRPLDDMRASFAAIDQAAVGMGVEKASKAFAELAPQLERMTDGDWERAFPEYLGQVRGQLAAISPVWATYAETTANVVAVAKGDLPKGLVLTEQGIMSVSDAAKLAAENMDAIPDAYAAWSAAALMGANDSKEAATAYSKWIEELSGGSAAFIDLQGPIGDLQAKQRELAEATAKDTKDAKDSWQDYYDGASINLKDYLKALDEQVKAQQDWQKNMTLLSARVSEDTLAELARMGPEGAPLVAELVNATDKELAQLETNFAARSAAATGSVAETWANAPGVWAALATVAGDAAVDAAVSRVAAGKDTIKGVIAQYDLSYLLTADTGPAIDQVNATIRMIRSKTATIKVYADVPTGIYHKSGLNAPAATGGYGADLAATYLAGGGQARRRIVGLVNGPGTPTSDSIPAWLSTKEFVQNAAAVAHYGTDFMYALNSRAIPRAWVEALGFAGGGSPGNGVTAPSSALGSILTGLQIGAFPISEIDAFARALKNAADASQKAADAAKMPAQNLKMVAAQLKAAEKDLAAAKKGSTAYRKAEKELASASKAVDPRSDLGKMRTELRDLKRSSTAGLSKKQKAARKKKIDDLQKKVDRAEDKRNLKIAEKRDKAEFEREKRDKEIAAAEKRVAKEQANHKKALDKNTTAQEKLKAAQDAQTAAQRDLEQAHKQLADAARQLAEQYASKWMTGGDVADWLADMNEGIALGGDFATLIQELRKAGLDEALVQKIISDGETWGGELAREILKGGQPTVVALNTVAVRLDEVSKALGMVTAIGVPQYGVGGTIRGRGTGSSDQVLMYGSNGEYVVRTSSAQAIGYDNLDVLNATGRLPVTASLSPATQTITYRVTQHIDVSLPNVRDIRTVSENFSDIDLNLHRAGG